MSKIVNLSSSIDINCPYCDWPNPFDDMDISMIIDNTDIARKIDECDFQIICDDCKKGFWIRPYLDISVFKFQPGSSK